MNNFENLLEQYSNLVFSVCLRIVGDYFEAQDLTQETFIAAFKGYNSFEGGSQKAWLCKIATNKCLDYLKKKRPIPTDEEEMGADLISDPSPPIEERIIHKETAKRLNKICQSLKEPYRSVAINHFLLGLSPEETGIKLKRSPATVRTQIYRAKKLIRNIWKEDI